MDKEIIVALIVAVSSVICQILINHNNRKKQTREDVEKEIARAAEEARRDANLENRLRSIEQKLDIHNGYAEKLGAISEDIAVIKNDIQNLKGE